MWPFGRSKIAPDDLKRLDRLEERVESYERRQAAVLEDVDEYFRKINKARQRVVKEESDAAKGGSGSGAGGAMALGTMPMSRDSLKSQLRARLRGGA